MPNTTLSPQPALRRLKAVSDDTRLRILLQLAKGEHCVCDLGDELDAGQSLLSFHLRTLRESGLVTTRRVGRWVHYSINPTGFDELEQFLSGLREQAAVAPPCRNPCCD